MPNVVATDVETARSPRIGCIVLAAGRSRRFGRTVVNKLLAPLSSGSVVAKVLTRVSRSHVRSIVVVTGHQRTRVERALSVRRRRRHKFRFNPHYRHGMATSLQAGIRALPESTDGAVICLGDMPGLTTRLINRLIAAYRHGDEAVIPRVGQRRGNPVLLGRSMLNRANELVGDEGARRLLATSQHLRYVEADHRAFCDIDTRRDWNQQRRRNAR